MSEKETKQETTQTTNQTSDSNDVSKEISTLKETIKSLMEEINSLKSQKKSSNQKEAEPKVNSNPTDTQEEKVPEKLMNEIKKLKEEQRKILEEKKRLKFSKLVEDYGRKYNVVDTEIFSTIMNKYIEIDSDGNVKIKKDEPINLETGKPWSIDDIILELKKNKPFLFKVDKETVNNYENMRSISHVDRINKAKEFMKNIGIRL